MKKYLIVTKYIDKKYADLKNLLDHNSTLNRVKEMLNIINIKYKIVTVNKVSNKLINKFDGVITVGGDGTVLHVAKYMISRNIPFITINSQPKISVGHLTKFTSETFDEHIFLHYDDFETKTIYPIKVKNATNNTIIGYFTNDVLFSNKNPAAMSKYKIQIIDLKDEVEIQKSSGIWVSSEYGATAAIKSAGFNLPLPKCNYANTLSNLNVILYKVREPYQLKQKYTYTEGSLYGKSIALTPLVPGMCLWFDGSYDNYELNVGETIIVFGLSNFDKKYDLVIPKS